MAEDAPRIVLDQDVRALVEVAHLCFAATVTPEGRPSLSPKGTIRVWDDEHLFFLDIASPGTRRNLRVNPWIELNVVDQLSRRGYRFGGTATLHVDNDLARRAAERVFAEEGSRYPVHAVVLVRVESLRPLVSPGYEHIREESAMRALWKGRRSALDADFERYLDERGGGVIRGAP